MRFLNTANDPPDQIRAALTQGNSLDLPEVEAAVRGILAEVRTRGDAGLRDCVRRYSGADLDQFEVPPAEWDSAAGRVSAAFRRAVETALENLRRYHSVQVPRSWEVEEGGARLGQRVRPLDRVGILVPAGKAPLPSTLLMAAVPARAAGVPELIVSSPPA
ncbi:MAG: histidinol dehydrogenase, partial [Armatimonadetes bacterium]|nr:histidinol dehydrogenase [Armatimonadota bacterium]